MILHTQGKVQTTIKADKQQRSLVQVVVNLPLL